VRVFCEDETRLGLHLPVHRRLTGYGVNPMQGVAPLYDYSWLSAAVEPATGDALWGEFPRLEADCFPIFLRPFAQHAAESLNMVLLEQAPAQVAQRVQVPETVVLVWWPADSPALTPVERLWADLKRRIEVLNPQDRSSLPARQAHVAGLLQRYTAETIASLTGYAYLVEAAYAL
jgi:hypothetical protein